MLEILQESPKEPGLKIDMSIAVDPETSSISLDICYRYKKPNSIPQVLDGIDLTQSEEEIVDLSF